ncbi:MAG TPA: hypothetical protein VFZ53_07605 [Polyangiaceae bacterium]
MDTLAAAISKGITDSAAQTGPIKQIPITRYKNRNVFNPSGNRKRPEFTRDYYQNGKQLDAAVQFNADIENLNRLKPGRYLNRTVEVIERLQDNGAPAQIEIRYPNATADDRFAMTKYFRSFGELLTLILAEQTLPESRAS